MKGTADEVMGEPYHFECKSPVLCNLQISVSLVKNADNNSYAIGLPRLKRGSTKIHI